MIAAAMYFALGLATAGLLALMVAPALWRRAVRLTRVRIERSVPTSLAEIQADKDQLRAEFAMSTRRLELSVERLKEKAAAQLVEIDEKRNVLRRLGEEQQSRADALRELETREMDLRRLLSEREEQLALARSDLASLQASLAERSRTLDSVERALLAARASAEETTVELVARGTELDNAQRELAAERSRAAGFRTQHAEADAALSEARADLAMERQRTAALEARITRLESERAARLEESETQLGQLDAVRGELTRSNAERNEIDGKLAEATAAYAGAQARISELLLKLDQAGQPVPDSELQAIIDGLERDRDAIATEAAALAAERDRIAAENAELRRVAGADWEAERVENALLREKLNDIAAEVVRLGDGYRAATGGVEPAAAAGADGQSRPGIAPRHADPAAARSLTDRIRALQRTGADG